MNSCLRKATTKDFSRINDLFKEMLQTIYEKDVVEGYKDGDLDYYFSDGEDWICVAEIDGSIVGFLSIEVHRGQENYLYYDDFSVNSDYRGKGIGTALMNRAEEYCKSIGFAMVILHVEERNVPARIFYEKRGFTVLRNEETRLRLVKRLE